MKLYEALSLLREIPPDASSTFVYLACGFTPLHLKTFLAAELWRAERIKAEIQTGLYGDLPGSLVKAVRARADAVVCALEWADLDPRLSLRSLGGWRPRLFADMLATAQRILLDVEKRVEEISAASAVVVSLPTLPLPPIAFTAGDQASTFELELRSLVAASGARLARLANVKLLNASRIDRLSPIGERLDVKAELFGGFPYSLPHASKLAELYARLISSRASKKGLITDLDGTLWKGLVGEVGPNEISWTLEGRAQTHGLYQQLLAALADAGVLLACASKNDPEVVQAALARTDLVLNPASLSPIDASWEPKSRAVSRILQSWNISADAVVFVDDSPMELAEVSASHPDIRCILFHGDEQGIYQLLEQLRDLFGKPTLHEEDALRAASLRSGMHRDDSERLTSTEAFLAQAEPEFSVEYFDSTIDPRALELINKTNQFNLNGRRHTHASLRKKLEEPGSFIATVSYRDKYGPLGKIAVIAGAQRGATLHVDLWVMSCRAFSRRIEYWCLQELFAKFAATEITFDFAATERNGPLREFLQGLLGEAPAAGCRVAKTEIEACGIESQMASYRA